MPIRFSRLLIDKRLPPEVETGTSFARQLSFTEGDGGIKSGG